MNPKHVHVPTSKRALCPVCKKAVYSISGIHPQCAMSQAESKKPGGAVVENTTPNRTVVDPSSTV